MYQGRDKCAEKIQGLALDLEKDRYSCEGRMEELCDRVHVSRRVHTPVRLDYLSQSTCM